MSRQPNRRCGPAGPGDCAAPRREPAGRAAAAAADGTAASEERGPSETAGREPLRATVPRGRCAVRTVRGSAPDRCRAAVLHRGRRARAGPGRVHHAAVPHPSRRGDPRTGRRVRAWHPGHRRRRPGDRPQHRRRQPGPPCHRGGRAVAARTGGNRKRHRGPGGARIRCRSRDHPPHRRGERNHGGALRGTVLQHLVRRPRRYRTQRPAAPLGQHRRDRGHRQRGPLRA